MKSKGEREKSSQLNTAFQRPARRDKKVYFNEQCLIIEENNKRGQTRDLFRKIVYVKGVFHLKMGTIKDKSGRNLLDAEEIMKRWKEYVEELYKKDLNELDYYDDVISHPESNILECKVKWPLKSTVVNKASGSNEIPTELFKSLKEDAIQVLHSLCQQILKNRQWPQD